jgi:hypothetical protein
VKAHKKQKKDKGKKREREADVAAPAAPEAVAPVTDLGALLLGGTAKSFEDAGLASLFEPSKVRGTSSAPLLRSLSFLFRPKQCRLLPAPSAAIGARRPTPTRT